MTNITVPIKVDSIEKLNTQIEAAIAGEADMVELRLDFWPDSEDLVLKVREIVKTAKQFNVKIIATCRANWEGGNFAGTEESRMAILENAAAEGADYIDIEMKAAEKLLPDFAPAKTIISYHDFESKPIDLQDIVNTITKISTTAIPKIAYKADSIVDAFDAFDVLHKNPGMIAIAMGYEGLMTRLLAGKLDSLLTFASLSANSGTADGQITLKDMVDLYKVKSVNTETEIFGVIGSPIAHSRSPEIHNRAFQHTGVNGIYLPLLIAPDVYDSFMDNCRQRPWLKFRGFSVTIPHKHNAIDYIEKHGGFIDPPAREIGAVNTVLLGPDGQLSGYNTDYHGALQAVLDALTKNGKQLDGMKAAVLGAGGVSRAVVAGLVDNNVEVTIYNRTVSRAESLANSFNCKAAALSEIDSSTNDLIVNCTSIGMEPDVEGCPVSPECIKSDMVVFDTVYVPLETKLLKHAIEIGAQAVSGLDMFINQAVKQFELFTGTDAPIEHMSDTVRKK